MCATDVVAVLVRDEHGVDVGGREARAREARFQVAQAEAGILPKETGRFFARIVENCFLETRAQIERMS